MPVDVAELGEQARAAISDATSLSALEDQKVALLGRKGRLTKLLKSLSELPMEQRRVLGASLNELKGELGRLIEARKQKLAQTESSLRTKVDVTLPGTAVRQGTLHPTIQMMYDLNDAFQSLNFEIYDGPEISNELYEFDSMNFPVDHPARESMDTYWLAGTDGKSGADRFCLRPHLTGASVRFMQSHEPPFRFVYPGRVYRNETTDPRHERAFFQYEALIVDKDFPFSSGQLLVNTILETVFGHSVSIRMRAGFFPFVEPGFEIDMECLVCFGEGCRVCKNVGWLEIMPGGVPHPNVFRAGGIEPDDWMGFYLNVGLDRLVMMRYAIDDVRLFHGMDLRFLSQFR